MTKQSPPPPASGPSLFQAPDSDSDLSGSLDSESEVIVGAAAGQASLLSPPDSPDTHSSQDHYYPPSLRDSLIFPDHDDKDDGSNRNLLDKARSLLHSHSRAHLHSHQLRHARHSHGHGHGHSHSVRSPSEEQVSPRQAAPADTNSDGAPDGLTGGDPLNPPAPSPSYVTQVVQTVSLVQVVDQSGAPLETQTLYAQPTTVLVDPASGNTVAIPDSSDPNVTASAGVTIDAAGNPLAPSAAGAVSTSGSTTSITVLTSSSSTSIVLSSFPSLSESAPASLHSGVSNNGTVHPTLSGSHNATSTHGSGNGTSIATSTLKETVFGNLRHSTTSRSHGSETSDTKTKHSSSTKTHSDSLYSSFSSSRTTTSFTSSTAYSASTITSSGSQTTSSSTSDDSGSGGGSDLSTQDKQVIGGVVGGVAAAAFVLVLLLWLLKWKKRRDAQHQIGDGNDDTGAGMITGPDGDGGTGPGMSERAMPAAVLAAFASLTRKNNSPSDPGEGAAGGERGFYRVSGRKLPPVLTAGGDGYSDPRADQRSSGASGSSDYYRGSQAFDPISGGSTRLALGSPMRPVSGVPVMRSGPARTPVTNNDPFADPSPPSSPPPVHDPLGRSLASQNGSRGSGSRFTEDM